MNIRERDRSLASLVDDLRDAGIWLYENHVLKYETYFKKGGVAKVFVCPQSVQSFVDAVRILRERSIDFKVIGLTSNILLFDEITYSVILSTKNLQSIRVEGECLEVDCGYSLQDMVRVALTCSAKGFEGLEGIPGTVGGGVFMNAGAYGYTISDNLISVKCLDESGRVVVLTKQDCKFTHRDSVFKTRSLLILSATFKLVQGDRRSIAKLIEIFHIARHSYQEFAYPNLGSLFSISGGVYSVLFRKSPKFSLLFAIYKGVLKNPVSKFASRKRPNNRVFNNLFDKYVGGLAIEPSPKSINILVNDGSHGPADVHEYVKQIKKHLRPDIPVENEFVLEPCYEIAKGFEKTRDLFRKGFD